MIYDSWAEVDVGIAQKFHDAYIGAHADRLGTFIGTLEAQGCDVDGLADPSMGVINQVWEWVVEHGPLPGYRTPWAEARHGPAPDWYPLVGAHTVPSQLPPWCNYNFSIEALDLVSGLAAMISEVAIGQFGAAWVFGDDQRGLLMNRSLLALPNGKVRNVEPGLLEWYTVMVRNPDRYDPSKNPWRTLERIAAEDPDKRQYMPKPVPDVRVVVDEGADEEGLAGWFVVELNAPPLADEISHRLGTALEQVSAIGEVEVGGRDWISIQTEPPLSIDATTDLVMAVWAELAGDPATGDG